MSSITQQNIEDFYLQIQCCLATKGLDIARKLSVDSICYEDKVNFILAHIYKKIIRVYNDGYTDNGVVFPAYDCLDEDTMCNMINFLKNYCSSNNNCNCK